MLNRIKEAKNRVAGTKQVLRAIENGNIAQVFLARDADEFLLNKVRQACEDHRVECVMVETMQELGKACALDVGTACAGLLK